jgi:glycosyltransferase involved in cell wall biosynthesis
MLKETIETLFKQSLSKERFEIIIVDDGSGDGTSDMLNEIKNRTKHKLRTYRQENQLSGSARNLGIKVANGSIILSMDDDLTAHSDLLKYHLEFHHIYPETGSAVLGKVETGAGGVDLLTPNNRAITSMNTTEHGDPIVDVSYFTTQNVSLKKEFVIKAGMFTPGLPRLDDMDLAFRLKERALKLIYCSKALAIHNQPLDTLEKVVNSGKMYGWTLGEYYDQIPHFQKEITSLGARFSGGWNGLIQHPYSHLKDAVRRWIINKYTIGTLLRMASRIPVTNPPNRTLVRCCKEIWSYYYRVKFKERRRQLKKVK